MNSIEERFENLKKDSSELKQKRLEFMAKQPQHRFCRVHPNFKQHIDEDETWKSTNHNFGKLTAGYKPCLECLADAERNKFKGYGVPENLLHATFENFIPADDEVEHLGWVQDFCRIKRGTLIMLGKCGTGKSHLAVAALKQYGNSWYIRHNSLLRALRYTYRDKNAFDPVERAISARLLIIDDVGLSSGGRDELPFLHEILDTRHGDRLPTIITSNLELEALEEFVGKRMSDRLRESNYRILKFNGESKRAVAREQYFKP